MEKKRLVLTEQPLGSEGLKLSIMELRPQLHRAKVAQCMFGSEDVENGKPHQNLTDLDVNDCKMQEAYYVVQFVIIGRKPHHWTSLRTVSALVRFSENYLCQAHRHHAFLHTTALMSGPSAHEEYM